jgi:hypothetical protein
MKELGQTIAWLLVVAALAFLYEPATLGRSAATVVQAFNGTHP